jgi:hypothetical protein
VNNINSLTEQNYVAIAEKDKVIAQDSVQIADFEDLKKKSDQKFAARKYLIGEKHYIWD